MSTYPVSVAVIDTVFARLSDVANNGADGFNAIYNALAVQSPYNLPADMNILFTAASGASPNFARANILDTDWNKTSGFRYPLMTLFTMAADNQNLQKFHQFSGVVNVGVNVFLSWGQSRVKLDFETYAGCIEEAMFTNFNRARNADPGDQDWGSEIVYNGDISSARSRIERGSDFWKQVLAFRATFEVNQRGEI